MNNATTMSKIRSFSGGASPGRVTADFFTDSHRFSASIVVYKRHLIDVLGDRMTDYLDLVDVYVSRNNNPGEIVHTSKWGTLVKEEINFIVLSNQTQAISKERFYSPHRTSRQIFLTVPFFEIEGLFQWMGDLEIKKLMATDIQKFLPILNVNATNPYFPDLNFQGPTALVNKAKIQTLCISNGTNGRTSS
jgi:hypothetical protein